MDSISDNDKEKRQRKMNWDSKEEVVLVEEVSKREQLLFEAGRARENHAKEKRSAILHPRTGVGKKPSSPNLSEQLLLGRIDEQN
uniref:Uncharacterized protein n=1 Tax=Magallana gigas TaxID=29159 RepID=K1QHG4_MAGGI